MRIAMIGAGGIAARHLEVLSEEPDVEIGCHLSAGFENAESAAARWGGTAYRRLDELLARETVDAAWVTVPPFAHGEIELSLVERGIPMFVEKPLSADRETARRVWARIEQAQLVTAVGYQWRALDTLPQLRAELDARPPSLVLGSWQGTLPDPAWWRRRVQSGGQMVEQATHLFDLARLLVGEAQVEYAAEGGYERPHVPDADVAGVSLATLSFAGGALGSFSSTNLLARSGFVGLQLVCDGLLVTVTREGVTYEGPEGLRESRTESDPFVSIDRAFLRAVRDDDPTLVHSSYADAMRTHELVFDVAEAAKSAANGSGNR